MGLYRFRARWKWFLKEIKQVHAREWLLAVVASLALIIADVFLLGFVGFFAATKGISQPPAAWDIFHDNLPGIQGIFRLVFNAGWWISVILIVRGLIEEPKRIPYVLFACSLWGSYRILCIYVTIFGAPTGLPPPPPLTDIRSLWDEVLYGLGSQNILFFSGHTGLPVLGGMLFRGRNVNLNFKIFRISLPRLLAIWSFVMGFTVLITREHYSVDVILAPPVTIGVWWMIKNWIWPKLFDWVDRAAELMEHDYKEEFSETGDK